MFILNLNRVHSYVDIITNSSTVIYTYSGGSLEKGKELIQAMLDLFDVKDKAVDDMFKLLVVPDDPDFYEFDEYIDDDIDAEMLYKLYDDLKATGSTEQWFMDALEKYAQN